MCAALWPDVVLMDIRMPGHDGIEATRDIVASLFLSKGKGPTCENAGQSHRLAIEAAVQL